MCWLTLLVIESGFYLYNIARLFLYDFIPALIECRYIKRAMLTCSCHKLLIYYIIFTSNTHLKFLRGILHQILHSEAQALPHIKSCIPFQAKIPYEHSSQSDRNAKLHNHMGHDARKPVFWVNEQQRFRAD